MHSISRLVLHPHISNIQTSWVKMGIPGVVRCLNAGANDLGGTLMNESITRAAGEEHGQEFMAKEMNKLITSIGKKPRQRTTLYENVTDETMRKGLKSVPLKPIKNELINRKGRKNSVIQAQSI